jgi:hypothetical protein
MTVLLVTATIFGCWYLGLLLGWALELSDEAQRQRRIKDARLLRNSIEGPEDKP